ncbi:MAG: hypothetical protein M3457_22700 [Chloroflexota bacterium]|nr:hypothetical protein [Chloroflexota bacterium]
MIILLDQNPGFTLVDRYDLLTMPPALTKAHAALVRAVDRAPYFQAECRPGERKPPRSGELPWPTMCRIRYAYDL